MASGREIAATEVAHMLVGYAEPDEVVFGWDELALWCAKHRWLVWGIAGIFAGWLLVGLSPGGWEDLGHGNMFYNPPAPWLAVVGRIIQLLAALLLVWGVERLLYRKYGARRRRLRLLD